MNYIKDNHFSNADNAVDSWVDSAIESCISQFGPNMPNELKVSFTAAYLQACATQYQAYRIAEGLQKVAKELGLSRSVHIVFAGCVFTSLA